MTSSAAKTVLITGASGGIGKALALCFAKHHYQLILVARSREHLEEVASQCRQLSQQTAVILPIDLAEQHAAARIYRQIQESGIPVDVLINNAGIGCWGDFIDLELAEQERVIQINVSAVVQLTHFLVNDMVQRKSGRIINIASVYAYTPVPYQAVYAASKAFLLSFSSALSYELRERGVHVLTICPGTTLTGFRKQRVSQEKKNVFTMTAEEVAELTYDQFERTNIVYTPGFINKIFVVLPRIIPMKQLLHVVVLLAYKLRGYKKLTDKK